MDSSFPKSSLWASLEISNLCRHESKLLRYIFWSCIKIAQIFVTVLYFNKTVRQSNCTLDIIKTYMKSIFTFNFTHVKSRSIFDHSLI